MLLNIQLRRRQIQSDLMQFGEKILQIDFHGFFFFFTESQIYNIFKNLTFLMRSLRIGIIFRNYYVEKK